MGVLFVAAGAMTAKVDVNSSRRRATINSAELKALMAAEDSSSANGSDGRDHPGKVPLVDSLRVPATLQASGAEQSVEKLSDEEMKDVIRNYCKVRDILSRPPPLLY